MNRLQSRSVVGELLSNERPRSGVFFCMIKLGILASALFLAPSLALADHVHDDDEGYRRRRPIDLGVGMHYGWYRPIGAEESMGGLGVSFRHPIDSRVTFEASGTYFEK